MDGPFAASVDCGAIYEPFSPLDGLAYGNGVALALGHDLDGRITAIDAADGVNPVLDLDYALYDLAGNIRTVTDAGGTGRDRSYVYDELHRLTGASGGIPTETYSYDEVGNRTSRAVGAAAESYAYDAASNRLLSVTGAATRSLTYSDSGNTAQDDRGGGAVLDYAYDASDRLVAVTQGAATLGAYVHNAMGQRVAKTVGGATTHFLYDLSGRLVGEADGATGAATAEYVWLEGMPLAFVQGSSVYYVHADYLGTPQRLTDASKTVVWDASYAPFGGATVSGSVTFNLRFPGQYEDAETGLNYNYFRDYDPALGRYVQSDPIGLLGGWNTYGYVFASPVLWADPLGLGAMCRAAYVCAGALLGADMGFDVGCAAGAAVGGGGGLLAGGPGGAAAGSAAGCAAGGLAGGISGAIAGGMAGNAAADMMCEEDKECSKATPWQLAQAGISDPHEYKKDYGAEPLSAFDICACKDGSIVIKTVGMCGHSGAATIPTFETWK